VGTLKYKTGGAFAPFGGGGSGGATGTGNSAYFDTATSANTVTLTADATPHTVAAAWTDIVTSTAHASDILIITIGHASSQVQQTSVDSSTLLDIGLWNGSSYDVLIEHLVCGQAVAGKTYIFNLAIASGARLGGRIRSATASKTVPVSLAFRQSGSSVTAPTSVTTYNALTASSSGTPLTTAGSIHTESDWLDLNGGVGVIATRKMVVGLTGINNSAIIAAFGGVDIGLWNGSSYDAIISDIGYMTTTSEQVVTMGNQMWFDVDISAGQFLAARYRATSTSASAKPHLAIYCSP
jgi:hypothetical protein